MTIGFPASGPSRPRDPRHKSQTDPGSSPQNDFEVVFGPSLTGPQNACLFSCSLVLDMREQELTMPNNTPCPTTRHAQQSPMPKTSRYMSSGSVIQVRFTPAFPTALPHEYETGVRPRLNLLVLCVPSVLYMCRVDASPQSLLPSSCPPSSLLTRLS